MPDFLILLRLGGVVFLIVKWLIFRKPFPYPLSVAEQHNLGRILTKLSDAFEAVEQTRHTQPKEVRGNVEGRPITALAAFMAELEANAQSLAMFSPEVVTYVALGHIRTSMSLGRPTRAQAQSEMLNALQYGGFAAPSHMFL